MRFYGRIFRLRYTPSPANFFVFSCSCNIVTTIIESCRILRKSDMPLLIIWYWWAHEHFFLPFYYVTLETDDQPEPNQMDCSNSLRIHLQRVLYPWASDGYTLPWQSLGSFMVSQSLFFYRQVVGLRWQLWGIVSDRHTSVQLLVFLSALHQRLYEITLCLALFFWGDNAGFIYPVKICNSNGICLSLCQELCRNDPKKEVKYLLN